jgi:DNA-binding transcriptional LysR family regulator
VACTATSYLVLLALLRSGIGVGVLPRLLAEAEGFAIVPADVPPRTLWRVVLEETRDVPRVRAVCEWLDATLAGRSAGLAQGTVTETLAP